MNTQPVRTVAQQRMIIAVPLGGVLEVLVNGQRAMLACGALSREQQVMVCVASYLLEERARPTPTNGRTP